MSTKKEDPIVFYCFIGPSTIYANFGGGVAVYSAYSLLEKIHTYPTVTLVRCDSSLDVSLGRSPRKIQEKEAEAQ